MNALQLLSTGQFRRRPLRVLCLGAHCDDIDIGCGGTLLELLDARRSVEVTWLVFSAADERERELRASAARFLRKAHRAEVLTGAFRDGFFPAQFSEIKQKFEALKKRPLPDVVFTHEREDRHQDHRVVSDLTWNTFRNHLILEYEIPKYDGGLTTPNAYCEIGAANALRKIKILLQSYPSQGSRHWFDAETFRGMLRLRGLEAGVRWAEGFHCRKFIFGG